MIDFVYNHDAEVTNFIGQLAPPAGGSFGRHKTIGVIDGEGRLIAGLVYFNFDTNAETIEFGAAAITPHWFTRATYRRMFEYPFVECGCQMLYGRVRAENEHLLSLLARVNFNLTMVPRMYGRSEDGVLCTLTDEQWLDSRMSKRIYRDVRREGGGIMGGLFNTPDPPNPQATAAAQTGTNVATAVANANLGNVNQVTPQGNLSYDQTSTFDWTDPSTGSTYSIPRFTATQTLNPTAQSTLNQSQLAQEQLAGLGNEQAQRLRAQFSSIFNPSTDPNAPAFGNVRSLTNAPQAQSSFGGTSSALTGFAGNDPTLGTFGAAPDIQQSYQHGDDFSADRQRIEEGLMGRLNPSLQQERNKYEQQLSDQGILYGSPAYENAMRNYSMQANDARFAAIAQGGQEQQRLSDMARQAGEFFNKGQQQAYEQAKGRGEFGNLAAQQQYEQAFGRGQFYNAGQQQDFAQAAQRGTFANAAQAQNFAQAQSAFNASNAARQQYLSEQFALRNQPVNEISALLSGSQVQSPNFLQTGSPTIPTTDVAGLINRNFDQQMAASNQQAATANNIIGGLFGFAGGLGRGGAFTPK